MLSFRLARKKLLSFFTFFTLCIFPSHYSTALRLYGLEITDQENEITDLSGITRVSGTKIPGNIPLPALFSIVYLGTFVSVGAYGLYNFAVSRIPANQAAAFINLIPVCTIVLGFLCLGERLTGWQLLACLLIFIGVMLTQENKSEREKL